jgi:ParB family chromosome partitioning protein
VADSRQKGMGRGLAAILAAAPREEPEELRQLPVELIGPNPNQPRRRFDEQALLGLADSIRTRGVIQPVLVRPLSGGRYELVAGERRWRAAQMADLADIPAVIRHHDDAASVELALIENMVREDLNPVEEARACLALVEELGLTREDVGLRVGRSRVAVSNLLRLLDLPDEVLDLIEARELTEGHGRALLLASENSARRSLARSAADQGWSVRELEGRARIEGDTQGEVAGATKAQLRVLPHPDQEDAVRRISDALGSALAADVKVKPAGPGYSATMRFESLDEALAFAERVATPRT